MFVDGDIVDTFNGLELVVTGGADLVERKAALVERSDCFIALPGGPGTCMRSPASVHLLLRDAGDDFQKMYCLV